MANGESATCTSPLLPDDHPDYSRLKETQMNKYLITVLLLLGAVTQAGAQVAGSGALTGARRKRR